MATNSQCVYTEMCGGVAHLWLLDDDQRVIDAFRKHWPAAAVVAIENISQHWCNAKGYRVLLIDSIVRQNVHTTPDAARWLRENQIESALLNNTAVIVYSGAPRNDGWYRAYGKSLFPGRELGIIGDLFERTVAGALQWIDWPEQLTPDIGLVAKCIHDLENLALPLRLDIETLREIAFRDRAHDARVVRDVWVEYFGEGDESGYLTPRREFRSGEHGLEQEITRIIRLLRGLGIAMVGSELGSLFQGGEVASADVAEKMGIVAARKQASAIDPREAETVTNDAERDVRGGTRLLAGAIGKCLQDVSNVILELAAQLRTVADEHAKNREEPA